MLIAMGARENQAPLGAACPGREAMRRHMPLLRSWFHGAFAVLPTTGAGAPGFTSNQFGFGISGPAASSFVVEASTNLHTWLPLSTNTFGVGLFQFLDPGSVTNPIRFYRTRY